MTRRRSALALAAVSVALLAMPTASYLRLYLDNPARPSILSRQGAPPVWPMLRASAAFYRDALGGGPRIDELRLEIAPEQLRRIVEKRAEAMRVGVLFASRRDLVPAALLSDGRRVAVEVRLKGDLQDHWARRRWSLRIEVQGDETVRGLRRFSLHPPWARGFHSEPLFFDLLRAAGFVVPRADFVDFAINGRHLGLMEVEEHFTADLLRYHRRPAGVLLKLDEDRLWQAWVENAVRLGTRWSLEVPKPEEADDWRNAEIDPFQGQEIRRSEALARDLARAKELIRGVMSDRLPPSAVFDPDLWGSFLAHCEIYGAPHMVLWNNLRFYFNPASGRIEPIGFDTGVLPERERRRLPAGVSFGCLGGDLRFSDTLVGDATLRRAFLQALETLDEEVHSAALETFLRRREARYLEVLRTEYPWLQPFDLAAARRRAVALRAIDEQNFSDHVPPLTRRRDPVRRVP